MDTLARIRLLTGNDPFWNTQNPTLLKGEVGFRNVEGDDPLMRVGDGIRPWNELPDMNKLGLTGPVGPIGPQGEQGVQGIQGPQGTPGDAQAPWRVPFGVANANDFSVMQLGWSTSGPPDYIVQPANNDEGFFGPYSYWFSPSERWGLPAGGEVLEIHHYWPGLHSPRASLTHPNVVATYWSVDGGMGPMIEILPSGAGRLGAHNNDDFGVYSSTMYWYSDDRVAGASGFEFIGSDTGKYGMPGGGTLNVWGLMSCHYRTAVPVGYPFYISNDAPNTMPGQNAVNGLRISAGYDRSDKPLRVVTTPGTTVFEIRGDGAMFAPVISRVTTGPFAIWMLTDGQIAAQSSSARYKTNIQSTARDKAREIVSKLRLVNFTSLCPDEDPNQLNYGLIAEEVAAVEPALAGYKDGRPEGVNYQAVTLLLLPLVQELLGMTEPTGESYG